MLNLKFLKKMSVAFSILAIFSTSVGLAAEVSLLTSIRLKQEYNDNILYTRSDEEDDFISSAIPSLELGYQTEILDLSALARWEGLLYWDHSDLNTINQRYGMDGKYRLTERWSLLGDGFYIKDTTLDSQLEETGVVFRRQDRHRLNAGAGAEYALSERIDLGTNYTYQRTDYNSSSSTDTQSHSMSVYYQRRLKNEIDVISVFPRLDYATSDDYDAYNTTFNVRWQHPFSETLDTSLLAGLRYTYIDYQNGQDNTTNWGGVADMWLRKRGELTTGRVGFSNQLQTLSDGSIRNVSRLYADADHRLSRRFGLGIRGSAFYSRLLQSSGNNDDRIYYDVSPSAFYLLTERHTLRLVYSFNQQYAFDANGDKTTDRQRVWLELTFNFPNTW